MKRTPTIIASAIVATVLAGGGVTYAVAQNSSGDTPITGSELDKASAAAIAEAGGGAVVDSEKDGTIYEIEVRLDDGTEVDVELDESFGVIRSEIDPPDSADRMPTDAERTSASEAALAETGGGTVTKIEADDNGYEVEVKLDDGTEIDVDLDTTFVVIATETDTPDSD